MKFEEVLAEMLAEVPDILDKREGSIMYNAVAPLAHKYTAMVDRYERLCGIPLRIPQKGCI